MLTIVSGLPRSGTSLMMQILEKLGFDLLCDENRIADESNPNGYYEYEKTKKLMLENSWLLGLDGKAIKIVSPLIPFIPPELDYRVIFMERNLDEVIESQFRMLEKSGNSPRNRDIKNLKSVYLSQKSSAINFIENLPNSKYIIVNFNDLFGYNENEFNKINGLLNVDIEIKTMRMIVDSKLYRIKNNLIQLGDIHEKQF